jgi:pyruvate/2-oxoglutarate dehydrogenase complex dihydrolipoamide acyltransferase (E2) component
MRQQHADYRVVPYTKYQRFAASAYRTVRHTPTIHGLFEVDVTRARTALREHKARTGESLSFTAFLTTCLAKAVEEDRSLQAFRYGGKHLALFDDVDITTRIIRAANHKTFRQQHDEIRAAQVAGMSGVLTRSQMLSFRLFSNLPMPLYHLFFWTFSVVARRRPWLWKQTMGTVGITSVGMFGAGGGWGIPTATPNALTMTVGGIDEKQIIVDGRPTTREYLSLTISVDHDIVDGAPAARFTRRLKELIESGYGLDGLVVHDGAPVVSEQARQAAGAPSQTVDAARA